MESGSLRGTLTHRRMPSRCNPKTMHAGKTAEYVIVQHKPFVCNGSEDILTPTLAIAVSDSVLSVSNTSARNPLLQGVPLR
jgi:hypothetical protein